MTENVIILDRPTAADRDAVHRMVKEKASGWWHHFSDVWIVSGETPAYWRDQVKQLLSEPSSSVLVLALPSDKDERSWSLFGANAKTKGQWLHDNYRR